MFFSLIYSFLLPIFIRNNRCSSIFANGTLNVLCGSGVGSFLTIPKPICYSPKITVCISVHFDKELKAAAKKIWPLSWERSLKEGRRFGCRMMPTYFLLCSLQSTTWRLPTAFAYIYAQMITLVGFFTISWIQSWCTPSLMWSLTYFIPILPNIDILF